MLEVDLARRPRSSFTATQKADVVFALAAAGALELKFLTDLGIEAAFAAMPCAERREIGGAGNKNTRNTDPG